MIRGKLSLLLELQAQDLRLRELEVRIKRLNHRCAELERKIAERRAALEAKERELEELRRESRRRNDEVDALDYKIRDYQRQLEEGIISYKEMEALREKIALSRKRMEELEEQAIALMDEIDLREAELAEEEREITAWEAQVRGEIAKLEGEIKARQAELERGQRERAELASRIEPYLLEQYERLRGDFGYEDPLARVEGGSCSGCLIRISENALEKLREGRELVSCENCHRILYLE